VLQRLEVEGDVVTVVFEDEVKQVAFVGPSGTVRQVATGVRGARITVPAADGYVRVVAVGKRGGVVLLNPVVRWDGVVVPQPRAQVRKVASWVAHAGWLALVAALWGLAALAFWRGAAPQAFR
jgi:hypothetical protein